MDIKASNQITLMNTDLVDAAKVATNYLGFSNEGLVVGDLTGSTLGKNVLIDSDSVNIRSGDTVLATFAEDTIELGKNSTTSFIRLCGNKGQIYASEQPIGDVLILDSDNIWITSYGTIDSRDVMTRVETYKTSNPYSGLYSRVADLLEDTNILTTINESYVRVYSDEVTIKTSGDYYVRVGGETLLSADQWDISGAVYVNDTIYVGSDNIAITGSNKVLWSGATVLNEADIITLSEAVTAQVTGIVLVFSGYNTSTNTAQNVNWNEIFIPKQCITYGEGKGRLVKLQKINSTTYLPEFGFKYVYIKDKTVQGNDLNSSAKTSNGVTYNSGEFILRYVIGV